MSSAESLNALEVALAAARDGLLALDAFLAVLLRATIFVPSAKDMTADGSGFEPLLIPRDGVPLVMCFSARSRIGVYGESAPYCLEINAGDFVRRLPEGFGLAVNPEAGVAFDVPPDVLERARRANP